MTDLVLSEPQRQFAGSLYRYPAFVGGFGSGKTFAGVLRAISLKSQCVGQDVAYYLPTYPLVRDIAFPRFSEVLDRFKVRHTLNKTAAEIVIPDYKGIIKFRTMDSPERIVGYEVAHSICDELDTLPVDKAREVWQKVIARNRQKSPLGNSVGVVTTPEGFRFVYERWQKAGGGEYKMYRARTMDNAANLPAGYIDSLRASYPSNLLQAYLDGEFVNLAAGSVYAEFDRALNATTERVRPGDTLHVGMDFNVAHGAAVVHVLRDDEPRAVYEYTEVFDTPAMIALLKRDWSGHSILIYPDASGGNRKSNNASESDLSLLKQAGFRICANPANPAVKDRVLSVNAMVHKDGRRRYRVNPETCPNLVESLEKQAYNKHGEPDKAGGFDHVLDAAGYFVTYRYPIAKRVKASTESLKL